MTDHTVSHHRRRESQRGRDDPAGAGVDAQMQASSRIAVRAPCFSIAHSPGPHSRGPVPSTSRCTGRVLGTGCTSRKISARWLKVE
jgi:hypothetical protein